jgi:hypothetical protein
VEEDEAVVTSLQADERAALLQSIDYVAQAEVARSADEWQRLGDIWHAFHEVGGPGSLIARPATAVEDQSIIARFAAYYLLPPKRGAPDFSGWFASGYLSRQHRSGTIAVRQLAIEPEYPGQTLTRDIVSAISLDRIARKAGAYLEALLALDDAELIELNENRAHVENAARSLSAAQHPLRARYEEVARLCLDEQYRRGRGVLERVRAELGRRLGREIDGQNPLPKETLREWIRQARREPFLYLEPGQRGRLDFRPGPGLRGRWFPSDDPPLDRKEI